MSLDFDSITEDRILSLLQKEEIVPRGKSVSFQSYPPNFDRKDTRRKAAFRVWIGDKVAFHLTAGPHLSELHRKARAFAEDNPEIACRPLFFSHHEGLDLFGQEYFGESNLEEGLVRKQIDESGWREAVVHVKSRLAATSRPSTPRQLLSEVAALERQLLAIECFARFDQTFLCEVIFPLIRHNVTSLPLETAWTNGDFVAKNILFDGQGHYRLIDYEFAHRTHFHQMDWFRLGHFSKVPHGIDLPALSGVDPGLRWMEILCWLQHALRLSEVCLPGLAESDLRLIARRLSALLDLETGFKKKSIFLNAIEDETRQARDSTASPPIPTAQLFLPAEGTESVYAEWQSIRAPVPVLDGWTDVAFDLPALPAGSVLRFDPCEEPGYLEVSRIEIQILAGDKSTEFTIELLGPQAGASALEAGGDCLALTNTAPFCFILFGSDPTLKLPPLPPSLAGRAGRLVVNLRFVSHARPQAIRTHLGSRLAALARQRAQSQEKLAALQRRHDELLPTLYAQNEAILNYEQSSKQLAQELRQSEERLKEEIQKFQQAAARAEAELALLRRRPLVRLDSALRRKKRKAGK